MPSAYQCMQKLFHLASKLLSLKFYLPSLAFQWECEDRCFKYADVSVSFGTNVLLWGKYMREQGSSKNCRCRRSASLWSCKEFGRGISTSPISEVHLNWTAWNIEVDGVSDSIGNVLFFGLALSFLLWITSLAHQNGIDLEFGLLFMLELPVKNLWKPKSAKPSHTNSCMDPILHKAADWQPQGGIPSRHLQP